MILAANRFEKSKNEYRTLITKTDELSDEIFSDFKPEIGQFSANRKFQSSKPEVEKYLLGKLVGFCNESPIFVF